MSAIRVTQVAVEVMIPFTDTTQPKGQTQVFGRGIGSNWWVVPQLTDSGEELRSKTMKTITVTGKVTNCTVQGYGYDVGQEVKVSDLEDGVRINGATRALPVPNTVNVAQSARQPINVKNAVMTTMRIAGNDRGQATRDQIDQITAEMAIQGVRR